MNSVDEKEQSGRRDQPVFSSSQAHAYALWVWVGGGTFGVGCGMERVAMK